MHIFRGGRCTNLGGEVIQNKNTKTFEKPLKSKIILVSFIFFKILKIQKKNFDKNYKVFDKKLKKNFDNKIKNLI